MFPEFVWPPAASATQENISITLLDVSGKAIEQLFSGASSGGDQQLKIPEEMPAGLYWVKVESEGKAGTKPVVVVR